ncbi:MAG: ATP-dependent Clp protease ATP-binding subunit ClpA [Gammaproteobacteria bacterium RIFCSPHIGHO2_02_FULL_42_13]|nr:MAG: ATP-dependent Clp protease ATP-binding subunit ClpA [Gammaproteobacteria bacterium RIFCSPHIGHO2_02_FULL_42_13]OGT69444.1 MAG: ATP-dependent Clp protease ATP-binding subunit ClpA [Gammaproteobacteria bacterium RIFCSPLOWO2_02_FULL_42_9]
MLDKELEYTLNIAFKEAREKRHEYFTVEHLVHGLLENSAVVKILKSCNVDIPSLKKKLGGFISKSTPKIPPSVNDRETQPTLGLQRVLQRAVFRAQSSGLLEATGAHVLEAIFDETASRSVYFLEQEGVTRQAVENEVYQGFPQSADRFDKSDKSDNLNDLNQIDPLAAAQAFSELDELIAQQHAKQSEENDILCNLNDKARQGKIDPLIGRADVIEHVLQVFSRRRKNNPLLVGEPGVGKTAIVEGIAKMIVEGKAPKHLSNSTVYSLDLGALLAGTKYRGDFEKRMKDLLEGLKKEKGAILFIDEIHTIIGAGSASGGMLDVSNLLKPLLGSGEFRCVGATTFQEYRRVFEKDSALARRFKVTEVPENTIEETIQILQGLRDKLEAHHKVKYTDEALQAAANLSARYINDRFLPDKAVDVVDEAGACHVLLPKSKQTGVIDEKMIAMVVAKTARIPEQNVSRSDKIKLKTLESDLSSVIYGQDRAISSLVTAIKLSRSGLRVGDKPMGSFLFAGPTGVGKTEVARQLARIMGVELLRFDMSEYQEHHTISRLVGAPPGYVGFDNGGLLTEEVYKHPHSVILLDEIEKAHADIYNLLLQVMDHGILTDSNGRKVDFRHTIIVMTTNAGASELTHTPIGFTTARDVTDSMSAIKRVFTPEFRNRLDSIVQFKHLDAATIASVVNKFLGELSEQLSAKHVTLDVNEDARLWLAEHGYDHENGARPMARLIDEKLRKYLADELLFGRLSEGGQVKVETKNDELDIDIRETVV